MLARFTGCLLVTLLSHQAMSAQDVPLPPPVVTEPPPSPPLPPELPGDPVPPCAPPCREKTVPHADILLVPRERAIVLPDWKLREVEVARVQGAPVLKFRDEKQYVTEMRSEPREVERQMVVTEQKPVTVTCPLTGKCHTEYHPCDVVKTYKTTVYEMVPVLVEVTVQVPELTPGPTVIVNRLQLDMATSAVIDRRYEAVPHYNEAKVVIPPPSCVPHH